MLVNNAHHKQKIMQQPTDWFSFLWKQNRVSLFLREGCGKSKWKFKMAFAMKGGGSRGGLECHIPILKNDFFKKVIFLKCKIRFIYVGFNCKRKKVG